jgi:hypothetical protein
LKRDNDGLNTEAINDVTARYCVEDVGFTGNCCIFIFTLYRVCKMG